MQDWTVWIMCWFMWNPVVGLKSCSTFLSLTDLKEINIHCSDWRPNYYVPFQNFPEHHCHFLCLLAARWIWGIPVRPKLLNSHASVTFCTGLLYLCSSTSASQIYLLLFLKEIFWDIYVAIWKLKQWQWRKTFTISILNSKHHSKQLRNCV